MDSQMGTCPVQSCHCTLCCTPVFPKCFLQLATGAALCLRGESLAG